MLRAKTEARNREENVNNGTIKKPEGRVHKETARNNAT
jgi:hypothetical protein